MKHEELQNLLEPVVVALGLECVGIEFAPSRGNSLVRLYIDAADRPVTLDDCEAVSREVGATLDVNDVIAGRYTLEVSSPGLERPLFTPAHFARFVGQEAKVQVNVPISGRRRFQGRIEGVAGVEITLLQDGKPVVIRHDNVLKANIVPDFAALGLVPAAKPGRKGKKGE